VSFRLSIALAWLAVIAAAQEPKHLGDENLEVRILAQGISDAMEMTIANDGRIFAIERQGKVKLIDPAKPGEVTTVIDLESDTRGESGLIGICLDPNFDENGWIYMYHTVPIDGDPEYHMHHLGRFDYKDGKIDPASEKVLLRVKAGYKKRIHEAGSIAFDSNGLLYLSCGDNQIRSEYLFSSKTSANSNDLRGKILRIRPTPEGGYTIPEGNLFKPGTPNTRPEIYIMGLRNPFRIHIDPKTDWLLWGENGPPNNWVPGTKIDKNTAPAGYDEFNLAKGPGFYGYPLIIANQQGYPNYDFEAQKTLPKFDTKKPVNDHKGNTGIKELPPSQPPLIWYQGLQEEFPELGNGGESAIAGPVYRFKDKHPKDLRLPDIYDGSWFIGEYARSWVKAAELDDNGKLVKIRHVLPPVRLGKPTNLKMGPKGRLHVLYYGPNGGVVRLEDKGQGGTPYTMLKSNDKPPKVISRKDKGLVLMAKSDCLNCHQWQTASVAPKYIDIAKRYKDDAKAAALLTEKVLKGGVGVWGQIPMPPHPQHTEEEAAEMVATILKINSLDQPKKKKKN
jgi:glucose/arabinose dehydrogenase/cytochrome c551/c552